MSVLQLRGGIRSLHWATMTSRLGSMAMLERARAGLDRLTPRAAWNEQAGGAMLVDLRTEAQRRVCLEIPKALVVDLTVLPWRLDPSFDARIPEATSWDTRYILICRHGYSSSLAAWNLRQMGLSNVTDVIGGVEAWVADGLPTTAEPADIRG